MAGGDVGNLLSDRISSLESRVESRFDSLEGKLERWMVSNGTQNIAIQQNADEIKAIQYRDKNRARRLLLISIAIAASVSSLLGSVVSPVVAKILRLVK